MSNAITNLEKVGAKVKPPKPTKKQLLQATALAVSAERQAKLRAIVDEKESLQAKLLHSASDDLTKYDCVFTEVTERTIGNQYEFGIHKHLFLKLTEEQLKIYTKIKELDREYNNSRRNSYFEVVYQELQHKIQNSPDEVVENLLKDDVVRKQLVKVGEKLLQTSTPEEKLKSITV